MPDRIPELFAELKRADVDVPSPGLVAARGRQRRRRARMTMCACAAAVIAGTGLAVQFAGVRGRPPAIEVSPRPTPPAPTPTRPVRGVLPPAGRGPLILGVNASGRFVMTRAGGLAVVVPGLPAVAGGPSGIATDPVGGWVVTYSADPKAPYGAQPARLAVVTPDGHRRDFGPVFSGEAVTSVAVSPDGSRVAVALCPLSGGGKAVIEVLPAPGHGGGTRTWAIPAPANWVDNLSWAPNGERLTYAVGIQTGAGIDGYPVTLDIPAPGAVAPVQSGWPRGGKGAAGCTPDVGAWLGATGRFAALEECDGPSREILRPADAVHGTPTGPASTVPGARPGCPDGALNAAPTGNPILITYCGVYLDDHGTITRLPGGLTVAAMAG